MLEMLFGILLWIIIVAKVMSLKLSSVGATCL